MKNAYGISSLARQLKAVAEKLDSLAMGVQDVEQNAPDLTGVYQNLLLDEVEHVQILTRLHRARPTPMKAKAAYSAPATSRTISPRSHRKSLLNPV